jgi:DNA-binding PadR family transcriptional regulator
VARGRRSGRRAAALLRLCTGSHHHAGCRKCRAEDVLQDWESVHHGPADLLKSLEIIGAIKNAREFDIISDTTMAREQVGKLELMVLLALLRVGHDAYGVPIAREIRDLGGQVSLGSVYAALDRLERKNFVSSSRGDPSPERGGRAKKFFQVTAKGMQEVQDSQRMLTSLWRNLAVLKGELA